MAIIESNKVNILNSSENIFNFLSDLNNLEKLMPSDKTKDWESDADWCKVKIKGMGGLGMKLKSKTEHSEILLESMSDKPFPFELKITIAQNDENADVQLILDAQVNPFMKMMVEKPLANFFNSLADKLQEVNQ
jgi:carbon monoxide dehydrogenase subunit G